MPASLLEKIEAQETLAYGIPLILIVLGLLGLKVGFSLFKKGWEISDWSTDVRGRLKDRRNTRLTDILTGKGE